MKKLLIITLALALTFSLAACGGSNNAPSGSMSNPSASNSTTQPASSGTDGNNSTTPPASDNGGDNGDENTTYEWGTASFDKPDFGTLLYYSPGMAAFSGDVSAENVRAWMKSLESDGWAFTVGGPGTMEISLEDDWGDDGSEVMVLVKGDSQLQVNYASNDGGDTVTAEGKTLKWSLMLYSSEIK